MNAQPPRTPRPGRHHRAAAFTLIEVMLAITILVGITLLAEQVVSNVSNAWLQGRSRAETHNIARALFNRIAIDLQNAVLPKDLPAFPEGDLAFYTRRPAIGGQRGLSYLRYSMESSANEPGTLVRADLAYSWNAGGSSASTPPWSKETAPTGSLKRRQLASHIIGFSHKFIQANGRISDRFVRAKLKEGDSNESPSTGVIITLAVADDRAMELLKTTGRASSVISRFSANSGGTSTATAETWESLLHSDDLLEPVRRGVRIFERAIALPLPLSETSSTSNAS
jgi:hypothetical protein